MAENRFVIVIPSYKNKQWVRKNLLSALNQRYPHYRIIYTDDYSPDGTGEEVARLLEKHDKNKLCTLVRNSERLGAMHNMYNMVHRCDDEEIIVVLDGDDWFAHSGVLDRLNQEYEKGAWMTWGQYRDYPNNGLGCSRQIPDQVVVTNSYRRFRWCSSHLRTYKAWLFKKIKEEDFKDNGKWLEMSSDLAAMFPMLEMSGSRGHFIPDILYIYNYSSPINDAKVNIQLQQGLERKIRAGTPYPRINER
jgi:glycosyltransferase involved in cell wall biosynthesis